MPAILFGSIGTLADTSELQREAFNAAFAEHGLDWEWSQADYAELLAESGGKDRVAAFAAEQGVEVDAEAVHRTKSERFRQLMAERGLTARPGVAETLRDGRAEGLKLALVTTTSPENVSSMLSALSSEIGEDAFDLVVDTTQVSTPKPDRAAYVFALEQLGTSAHGCVAVEDNLGGAAAASAAGVPCLAFPNQNTAGHAFTNVAGQVDRLHLDELRALMPAS